MTRALCLVAVAAVLGPVGVAFADPAAVNEYDLNLPGDSPGDESQEQVGSSNPAASEETAKPPATPAVTQPEAATAPANEPIAGDGAERRASSGEGNDALEGRTDGFAPPPIEADPADAAGEDGSIPTTLILIGGVALLVAAAAAWRLRVQLGRRSP